MLVGIQVILAPLAYLREYLIELKVSTYHKPALAFYCLLFYGKISNIHSTIIRSATKTDATMSNHSGGPPPPPNNTANGQEGRPEPIDDHRSQPQRPPNNVSNEHPPPNAIELWNEVSDNLDRNATGEFGTSKKS